MRATARVRSLATVGFAGATAASLGWGIYLNTVGIAAERALRSRPSRSSSPSSPSSSSSPSSPSRPARRFRVLIPAHDEEVLLGATLESMRLLGDHTQRVEVHVVADNCRDRTAEIARNAGVEVHERHDPAAPGKGEALAWLIDRLPVGDDDDAIVIIDADTLVDPAMLAAFDRVLDRGAPVVQGYYTVRDAERGGDVGFRAVALAVRHFVRPVGRIALGGSSSLYGNAMAFREDVARRYRWSSSLTEDLDMGLRLLLDGHTVGFAPDAVVTAVMPDSLEAATTQNQRWEAGRLDVAVRHVPALLRAAVRRAHGRRWAYLDAAIDISLPPLTSLFGATALAGAGLVATARPGRRSIAVVTAATASGLLVAHVLHSLRLADVAPEVRRSLTRSPAHVVWKTKILAGAARQRPAAWIRTVRPSGEVAA